MKKKPLHRISSLLAATVLGLFLLTGCAGKSAEAVQAQEDADTIQVYLWTNSLYEKYAPYVQAQLPDVNIEFIVGNNDLDFYKFLQENGGLPDIITCCRFSLHDAAPLKDSLMDLATTNEAGAVYNTYLNSFRNDDGSVNWLPVCVHPTLCCYLKALPLNLFLPLKQPPPLQVMYLLLGLLLCLPVSLLHFVNPFGVLYFWQSPLPK